MGNSGENEGASRNKVEDVSGIRTDVSLRRPDNTRSENAHPGNTGDVAQGTAQNYTVPPQVDLSSHELSHISNSGNDESPAKDSLFDSDFDYKDHIDEDELPDLSHIQDTNQESSDVFFIRDGRLVYRQVISSSSGDIVIQPRSQPSNKQENQRHTSPSSGACSQNTSQEQLRIQDNGFHDSDEQTSPSAQHSSPNKPTEDRKGKGVDRSNQNRYNSGNDTAPIAPLNSSSLSRGHLDHDTSLRSPLTSFSQPNDLASSSSSSLQEARSLLRRQVVDFISTRRPQTRRGDPTPSPAATGADENGSPRERKGSLVPSTSMADLWSASHLSGGEMGGELPTIWEDEEEGESGDGGGDEARRAMINKSQMLASIEAAAATPPRAGPLAPRPNNALPNLDDEDSVAQQAIARLQVEIAAAEEEERAYEDAVEAWEAHVAVLRSSRATAARCASRLQAHEDATRAASSGRLPRTARLIRDLEEELASKRARVAASALKREALMDEARDLEARIGEKLARTGMETVEELEEAVAATQPEEPDE
ncbi:hypothetical protein OQA88_11361 [Cercophora sp. LCS_1]